MPTADNPFMNPQLTDIRPDNNRPPAADVTDIKGRDKVNESLCSDLEPLHGHERMCSTWCKSQRNFYTVPEDDHAGFLAFLGRTVRQQTRNSSQKDL
jgi:hypothetical protein